jgi:hypothetical protein
VMIANVYTFCIYAFAVHYNELYLVYCAVLGLSVFALLVFAYGRRNQSFRAWYGAEPPHRLPGLFLIATATMFALLWLSEDIPAMLTGVAPASIAAHGLVVNPVHTLDYAVLLPLMIISGVLALRRHDAAGLLVPAMLVFAVAMSANIAVMMAYALAIGAPVALLVVGLMMAIAAVSAVLAVRVLMRLA